MDWNAIFQALGYGGFFTVAGTYIFVKLLWPFWESKVWPVIAAQIERAGKRDDAFIAALNTLSNSIVVSSAARDIALSNAMSGVLTSLDTRDTRLIMALDVRNKNLIAALDNVSAQLRDARVRQEPKGQSDAWVDSN